MFYIHICLLSCLDTCPVLQLFLLCSSLHLPLENELEQRALWAIRKLPPRSRGLKGMLDLPHSSTSLMTSVSSLWVVVSAELGTQKLQRDTKPQFQFRERSRTENEFWYFLAISGLPVWMKSNQQIGKKCQTLATLETKAGRNIGREKAHLTGLCTALTVISGLPTTFV